MYLFVKLHSCGQTDVPCAIYKSTLQNYCQEVLRAKNESLDTE